jgi:hypothetical protein
MALRDMYKKPEEEEVKMTLKEFRKEHVRLLRILRTGTKAEQLKEAEDQEKEMKEYD